jgi:hypothetical protein
MMKSVCYLPTRYILSGLLCLFGFMMQACQQVAVSLDINKQSYLQALPAGTILRLQQNIDIAPDKARTYFQHGKQAGLSVIDKYQPWCEFEIKTLMETTQTIHADNFAIYKLVNQRSGLLDGAGFGSMANTLEEFSTTLYLQSDSQPDVFRLICLHRRGTGMQTYLRLSDIQSALGDIATIDIK